MEIYFIVIAAVAAAVIFIFVFIRANSKKYIRTNEKYAEFIKRRENALWATALVANARSGTFGEMGEKARMSLTLEITPSKGEVYRAHTCWLVDLSELGSFSAGNRIQVKIDAFDPKIIYPGSQNVSYIP